MAAIFSPGPLGDLPHLEAQRGGSRDWAVEQTSLAPSTDREDDFAALKQEALRRLKEKRRRRAVVLPSKGGVVVHDAKRLSRGASRAIMDSVMRHEDADNMPLLLRIRERLERVGLAPPTITVRYRDLSISTTVIVGSRDLPSITGPVRGRLQPLLRALGAPSASPRRPHSIIDGASGLLRPGVFTLLLGPPQSGKTTLLRALAGLDRRTPGLKQRCRELTYNGHALHEFVPERSAAYISQTDLHYGELTVRETLEFSARFQSTGYKKTLLEELEAREAAAGIQPDPGVDAYMRGAYLGGKHALIVELITRLLGLEECADTVVGSAMLRGISGGQKKRVTTAEMAVGSARALFADEISTGLDSNTTYLIMVALRNYTHVMRATMLVGLLQPAPEVYDIFDEVMVLAAGKVVYHGPREEVLPFFETLGFSVPLRRGVADFLQEVTTPYDQYKYWNESAMGRPYRYVTPRTMQEAFRRTEVWRATAAELESPFPRTEAAREALPGTLPPGGQALARMKYGQSGGALVLALAARAWILVRRNKIFAIIRTCQVALMAFVVATVFWRENKDTIDDGNFFMGVLFYSLLYQLLGGVAEMHLLCDRLPVFFKQRQMRFFPGWAFAVPTFLLRVPFCLLESTLWTMFVYWIVGFDPSVRFLYFWAVLFLINVWSTLLFQLIAAICRDDTISTAVGSFMLLIFINISGFVIIPSAVPKWWLEGLWPNPFFWAMRGLAINEFTSANWDTPNPADPSTTLGLAVLSFRGFPSAYWWCWAAIGFIIATGVLNMAVFVAALTFLGPGKRRVVLTEEAVEEHAMADRETSLAPATAAPAGANGNLNGNLNGAEEQLDLEAGAPPQEAQQRPRVSASALPGPEPISPPRGRRAAVSPLPTVAEPDSEVGSQNGQGAGNEKSGGARAAEESKSSFLEASRDHAVSYSHGSGVSSPRRILPPSERFSYTCQAAERYRQRTALPFSPLVMTFRGVEYSVPLPKGSDVDHATLPQSGPHAGQLRLLKGIDGVFRPYILCSLMGSSGAGKTTLMDCLAGRKTTGTISGDILVNGFPKEERTFAHVAGYVEQTDIHLPQTSVKEALEFSARLRLPTTVDAPTRAAFVDEILQLVELDRIGGAFVGVPGTSGLSVEQRKRLTLAVELVANPAMVFMDEPTSGLDARAAGIVMQAIRNTVDSGRVVVCTIHQPSADIFESFDELLLLKPGGETAYFGPLGDGSERLLEYLQAIPGTPHIKPNYNPANFMLQVTSPRSEEALHVDFAAAYRGSQLAREMDAVIKDNEAPAPGSQPLQFAELHVVPWSVQFGANFQRFWRQYWRSPEYNLTRLLVTLAVAFVFATLFWRQGDKVDTPGGVLNVAGLIFASVLFIGITDCLTIQHLIAMQRTVFYRERAAGYYGVLPYALAQQLVELPYLAVQTVLYSSFVYWAAWIVPPSGPNAGHFFLFQLFFFVTLLYFVLLGIAAVNLTPIVPLANVLCSFFFGFYNLLSGFLIPYPALPKYWQWAYWLNPVAWSLYSLAISQLGGLSDVYITDFSGQVTTVPQFLAGRFNWHHSMMWVCLAPMLGFVAFFSGIAILALKKINYQRR